MVDRILELYNEELELLRDLGGRFAQRYPKVAGRLRITADAVDDPHISRLVESFAFIAARLRLKLDDDFPELTQTLFETLYPHYLAPIPALAIAQFQAPQDFVTPITVPRGQSVDADEIEGDICRFRTTQEVTLWPIHVTMASLSNRPIIAPPAPRLDAAAALRVVLETLDPRGSFTELGLDTIRFYIRAPWARAAELYELLLNGCLDICVGDHPEDGTASFLGKDALRATGFFDDEAALPPGPRDHPAYRLLTEFFAYPHKFFFIELSGLSAKTLRRAGSRIEIFFYLSRFSAELARALSLETFSLGCTPIINLFSQPAEPILLTRDRSEYAIVPDSRRHATREVYSVDRVVLTERSGAVREAKPLFGHSPTGPEGSPLYWQLRRRRMVDGDPGTDARLAIVDASANLLTATDGVLSVDATCLNRDLPSQLPYGGVHPRLHVVRGPGEIETMVALTPLTPTVRLPNDEGLMWRLMSHLTLGHLSLGGDRGGPESLREILRLYHYHEAPELKALIEGIVSVRNRHSTARIGGGGLARGLDIEVEFQSRLAEPGATFLFGQMLDHFLGLYVNLNSFTRLTVLMRGTSKPLKTWPPRSGARPLS